VTNELRASVLNAILTDEGGLANDPDDRGGLTKFGMTRPFLETVTMRKWSDDEIRNLTREKAEQVFDLWTRMRRLDQLPEDFLLAWVVIDFAYITTERRAIRALQKYMGITQDGIAGAETQGAWHRLTDDERRVAASFVVAERAVHHGNDITRNPIQAKFAASWMNRLAKQIRACAG
jgi:lysozyme family protein